MVNKFTAIGRLTRDPETRHTPGGKAITNFGLALDEGYKDANGEWKNNVTFTEWQAWNGLGENLAKLAKKGDLLYAEGKFSLDSWEDKNTGEKRSTPRFTALGWKLLSKSAKNVAENDEEKEEKSEKPAKRGRPAKTEKKPEPEVEQEEIEDDIPF